MARLELGKTNSYSDEEEEVSSEPEKKPPPPPSYRNTSSVDSESDTDSPLNNSKKADPSIKPLASKPMDDEPFRKPRPKNPISRYSPPPLKSITGKRKAVEVELESRESKIENAGEKKPLFQRLWSENDEIELIKGMIKYVEKKGKYPIGDVNDFHEFVKNSLNIDVNNGQMSAKIKRLKSKFMNNVGKIELKGKVRSLSNPHEKRMYELSEKLWGSNKNKVKNAVLVCCSTKKLIAEPKTFKMRKNGKSIVSGKVSEVNLGMIRFPITDDEIMRRGLEFVSSSKKVELKEKWNNLKVQELQHFLKKLDLLKEQAELALNAIK